MKSLLGEMLPNFISFSSNFNCKEKVEDYLKVNSKNELFSVNMNSNIKKAIEIMKNKGYSQITIHDLILGDPRISGGGGASQPPAMSRDAWGGTGRGGARR